MTTPDLASELARCIELLRVEHNLDSTPHPFICRKIGCYDFGKPAQRMCDCFKALRTEHQKAVREVLKGGGR